MQITVLTDPPFRIYFFLKWLKLKLQGKSMPKYGGHYAVTRSVVEGLQKIDVDVNYNPSVFKIHKVVYVPGCINALRFAIFLKKIGLIKKLIAGPNLVILPTDNKIILDKAIDRFIVNSFWVKDFFVEDCPLLADHINILPAGVDANFWEPKNNQKDKKNILIYYKRPTKILYKKLCNFLADNGFNVETIFYGNYNLKDYKEALERNYLVIYLVEQESQGISLSEAWSMNVPTIVWNPGFFFWYGKNYEASSAPYLSNDTGVFFKDFENFLEIYNQGVCSRDYSPRQWVLENLSDEKCADKLLGIINEIKV